MCVEVVVVSVVVDIGEVVCVEVVVVCVVVIGVVVAVSITVPGIIVYVTAAFRVVVTIDLAFPCSLFSTMSSTNLEGQLLALAEFVPDLVYNLHPVDVKTTHCE